MPALPAVFLDRDGVLNQDSAEFVKTPDEYHVLPGVPEAVARLNAAGFLPIVVTNQSGVARGLVTPANLEAMHAKLRAALAEAGGSLAAIYHCPHLPTDGCTCRKPAPGMIRLAATEHGVDLARSFMVGDKPVDIACGRAAGCRTVLVLTGHTAEREALRLDPRPDHVAPDLDAAVTWILATAAE